MASPISSFSGLPPSPLSIQQLSKNRPFMLLQIAMSSAISNFLTINDQKKELQFREVYGTAHLML